MEFYKPGLFETKLYLYMLYECFQSDIQYYNPWSRMKSSCHMFMPKLLNKYETIFEDTCNVMSGRYTFKFEWLQRVCLMVHHHFPKTKTLSAYYAIWCPQSCLINSFIYNGLLNVSRTPDGHSYPMTRNFYCTYMFHES